ncbi:MAG: glycosyltransferase family 4 protein [Ktedonobacterales bacterium]
MRIAIDYTSAITELAGIGRYTRGLARALSQYGSEEDSLILFTSQALPSGYQLPEMPHARLLIRPVGHRNLTRLWHQMHVPLPAEPLMGWPNLIHGPDFVLPPAFLARRIVTIHDLAYLIYPGYAQPGIVDYLSEEVPRALRAADHVIAVSKRTAVDLIERLRVSPERISVIYPGVDPIFTPEPNQAAVQKVCRKYDLAEPFVLAVSTIEPRKNYERLIEAFAAATREPDGPRFMVFAGRRGWLYEGVSTAIHQYPDVADRIRVLGYVPDEELAGLYHAAAVLAMPSFYEGFGIPVIEAMACGTPVICGTGGALPEIAGNAALLLDPYDVAGLRDALVSICSNGNLRSRLIAEGFARAGQFTWEAAAQAHFHLYHQTMRVS